MLFVTFLTPLDNCFCIPQERCSPRFSAHEHARFIRMTGVNSGDENVKVKGVTLLDTQQKTVVAGAIIGHQCWALECQREDEREVRRNSNTAPAGTVM